MRKSMDQAAEVWRSGQRESRSPNSRKRPLADVVGDEDVSGSLVIIAAGPPTTTTHRLIPRGSPNLGQEGEWGAPQQAGAGARADAGFEAFKSKGEKFFDKVQRRRRRKKSFGFTLGGDEEFSDIE